MSGSRTPGAVLGPLMAGILAATACGSAVSPGGSSSDADNGEASKEAGKIITDAAAALRGVTSYHIAGTIRSNGTPLQLDFKFTGTNNASGSMLYKGAHFDVTEVNGQVFVHGAELWRQAGGTPLADLIGDRWVNLGSNNSASTEILQGLSEFGRASSLADALVSGAGATPTKGPTSTVDGVPVISVTGAGGAVLAVATTGKPYPVRISRSSGSNPGQVDIGDFDASFSITAPTNVVDASALSGSLGSSSSTSTST